MNKISIPAATTRQPKIKM